MAIVIALVIFINVQQLVNTPEWVNLTETFIACLMIGLAQCSLFLVAVALVTTAVMASMKWSPVWYQRIKCDILTWVAIRTHNYAGCDFC
jgi:hypothetical protein